MTATIYHNPRCSKSRQTLALLEEKGINVHIKEYLKEGLTPAEVESLWSALGEEAKNIVRVKEEEYKSDKFSTEDLTTVAARLSSMPKLLERPIVIVGNSARIGRPPENVLSLFE